MKNRSYQPVLILLGILLAVFPAFSQIREAGEIRGTITEASGDPLSGVSVTIEGSYLIGGPQSTVTDARGFYRFRSLPIGTYKVTAALSGFKTMVREGIELHAGFTLTCDFKMSQAAIAQEVEVVAEIPTIDTKSSQPKPIIYTDEFLNALPGKSSWSGLASYAPGVSQSYSSVGYGWLNDGISVSYPFNAMSAYNPDTRIIKEVAVQSLGLPAEYGEFSGVVLSSISKSGSNKFSTFNEITYYGKKWNSQNAKKPPVEEWYSASMADQVYATIPFYEVSSQFGGKIIRDKLWFYIAGEYSTKKTPITGLDKSRNYLSRKGFLKFTCQLNNSNKFNLSVNHNFAANTNGAISVINPDIGYDSEYPNWFGSINWTSIFSPTTFLDVKAGYNNYSSKVSPHGGLETFGIYDQFLRKYINNYTDATATSTWNYHANAHLSHYLPDFIKGSHDLKAGLEFIHYKILWDRKAPGDRIEYYYNGVPSTAEDRKRWAQDTYTDSIVCFLQDRWSLTDRLTLNLGARFDYYRFYFPSDSSPRGAVYNAPALAPRLGITFDVLGDRKNIIKLNYSRYYEGMSRNWFGNFEHRYEGGAKYSWDAATKTWVMTLAPTESTVVSPVLVDRNINQPNIWEISGGYERELFRDASLSLNFWWRGLGDAMYVFYYDDVWAPYTTTNPGPDGRVGTADDMGPITIYTVTTVGSVLSLCNPKIGVPPWMQWDWVYKDRAIELRFTKKFSRRWQLMASYSYHRVTGNVEGSYAGGIFDPNRSINAYGERGNNLPHQFLLQGNVLLPLDISFSAVYYLKSGIYRNETVVLYPPVYRTYPQIYINPVGSKQADPVSNLDLRFEKQVRVKGFSLGLGLDVFNATNNYGGSGELGNAYGTSYGKRSYIKAPRIFQMTIRIIY
jgi:hypothetical protein